MAAIPAPRSGSAASIRAAREAGRARLRARTKASYNPWLQLAASVSFGLAPVLLALLFVRAPTWKELLTVPITWLAANGLEWRAHKDLLHRRVWPLHTLYDRHTPEHHVVFGYDDMAIRSAREMKLVLLPAVGVLGIVLAVAPAALAVAHFFGENAGWLMVGASGAYVLSYELSHLAYHLPENSPLGRLALVRVLREQHRRHHHPRLMQKWNFNVTVPLFDWLHRTTVPEDVLARTLAEDAGE
jgi:hypothetical protein